MARRSFGRECSSSQLDVLLRKFDEDALFRRLAIGSPTFREMLAEAIMKDRTGKDYHLATHNEPSIDLVAADGKHVQVKTVGTLASLAVIKRRRDAAQLVMVITTFGEGAHFFLVPMERFKTLARTCATSWEISGHRIKRVIAITRNNKARRPVNTVGLFLSQGVATPVRSFSKKAA
jgi:hypothetical protein